MDSTYSKAESIELEAIMTPEERALFDSFKAMIGKPVPQEAIHDVFYPLLNDGDVRWSLIRKWATVNGDFNPLWFDEEYAKKSRWGGITAPPLFMLTVHDGSQPCAFLVKQVLKPSPYPVINREKYPNFRGVMQSNCEWEFFEPLRPGDKISALSIPTEAYWKKGKRFRLLFTAGETEYTNQRGQKVVFNRMGGVYMFKHIKP
jgi:acyl dehydratase